MDFRRYRRCTAPHGDSLGGDPTRPATASRRRQNPLRPCRRPRIYGLHPMQMGFRILSFATQPVSPTHDFDAPLD
jgi:hypothetical protein